MSLAVAWPLPGRRPRPHRAALAAILVLGAIMLVAVLAGEFAPYPPRASTGSPIEVPSARHRLGTDDLGQDLLSAWLVGGRVSLMIGFVTAVLSTAASGLVGIFSVTYPPARSLLLTVTDGVLAIPHLPVIVLIVALLGPGALHIIVVLALLGWPAYARVVRAQALVTAQRDYVVAARALGASDGRILKTCVLPEILPLLWTKFLLTVRWAILMEATLSLMGLGDPARISWGTMLNNAFAYPLLFIGNAWLWWAAPPALAIAVVTLALSAVGRDLETRLNPAATAGRRFV